MYSRSSTGPCYVCVCIIFLGYSLIPYLPTIIFCMVFFIFIIEQFTYKLHYLPYLLLYISTGAFLLPAFFVLMLGISAGPSACALLRRPSGLPGGLVDPGNGADPSSCTCPGRDYFPLGRRAGEHACARPPHVRTVRDS